VRKVNDIVNELDPDMRQCMLCKKYKPKEEFEERERYTSPLEQMICLKCLVYYYAKRNEEPPEPIQDRNDSS